MRLFGLAALACVLSTAPAPAQTVVDPPAFRWLTTQKMTGFPFGYPTRRTVRLQQVHDGLRGRPTTVSALAMRRAPTDLHPVPAFDATVSLRIATAATTAATITSVFADNLGADARTVLDRRVLSMPATQGPAAGPAPFAYALPADTPFAFGGAGPLAFELVVHDHANSVAARFALHAEGGAHTATIGSACGGLDLQTSVSPTAARHVLTGAPPSAPLVFLFGVELEQLGAIPLPFDLTALGAPGCQLGLAGIADLRAFADASGGYSLDLDVSAAPPGFYWGAQALAVHPALNALGVVTSQTAVLLPAAARSVGRVWSEDLAAAAGVAQPVYGAVIEVR